MASDRVNGPGPHSLDFLRSKTKQVNVTDYGVTDVRDTTLPIDSDVRKAIPIARGVLDYFPAALVELAKLAEEGNRKHNPGEELHWARGKSMDHADCIMRHLIERGTVDTDGFLHDVKVAWRALAQLQEALEARGAPLARGARPPNVVEEKTPHSNGHTYDTNCFCPVCRDMRSASVVPTKFDPQQQPTDPHWLDRGLKR